MKETLLLKFRQFSINYKYTLVLVMVKYAPANISEPTKVR